jgi:hypothetical protein
MYKVMIGGVFRGNFKDITEAMEYVDKFARPHRLNWEIVDAFGKIYAQS